ncbi:hypothetical protein RB653_003409 [Dictyostelium firmibasis]|uniref:dual-specificity kinase n=1 Tax=Dictyostelium firmibasis TaxID=79012 RepID=A0AAN7U5R8_9MYCE
MTSLHKQIIESHNNDITKLKSSMSTRAAARRSVCLSSMSYTLGADDNEASSSSSSSSSITPITTSNSSSSSNNNSSSNATNTTSTISPLKHTTTSSVTPKSILVTKSGSKEEPIVSSSSKSSSTNNNFNNLYSASTFSSSTKKVPERPSINPGFRKPREAFLSGNTDSTIKKSTPSSSSSNIKAPIQISHSRVDNSSSSNSISSNNEDSSGSSTIKHTAASLSKMKLSPSHTISDSSRSSTMKTRSVSISNGSLFSPNNTSVNNTSTTTTTTTTSSNIKTPTKSTTENLDQNTPPSTKTTSSSSSTNTTPSKSSVDDVFARLANVTKPVIKSRSLSVSASLAKVEQSPPTKEKSDRDSSSSSTSSSSSSSSSSFSSKFTKILRSSSKTPTPSSTSTTTTQPATSLSASKITSRKDTKSLSSFSSTTKPSSVSSTTKSTITSSTSSNNLTNILTQSQSISSTTTPTSTSPTSISPPLSSSTPVLSPSTTNSTTTTPTKPSCTTITPSIALKLYINDLTSAEQSEILDYPQIYFTGNTNKKTKFNSQLPNNGYDNDIGEYKVVERDHIAYRFEVVSILGQGSFCQVVKGYDYKTGEMVALKILRNQKRFHNQALTEIKILEYLKTNDPNSTASIVHLNNYFYFRNHLILTFELLSMNLYDFLKVNQFQGYNLNLVRRFGAQILTSLRFLAKRNIIHADLKPENILLKSPTKSGIKLIDFGSSCFENEQIFTYIQSRFYRSPEVILGTKYDKSIDIWSLGCILVEIFTGVPLFPGSDEPEQLACIMEVLGAPPKSVIDNSTRRDIFFEEDGTPKPVKNSTTGELYTIGTKSFKDLIRSGDDDFDNFIFDCLKWEPSQRISAEQGLKHDWIIKVTAPTTPSTPS